MTLLFSGILAMGLAQVKKPQNDPTYDYKWLHFGFTVGLNTMDFSFMRPAYPILFADVSRITPGFQVSIVSELRLADYWSLRFLPGITFGQRTVSFYRTSIPYFGLMSYNELDRKMEVESNYIDFPLLIKYKSSRVNNYRPYLIGGMTVRYDMASRNDYEEDSEVYIRLKKLDLCYELGLGLDNYLRYFKFSTELKISVGLRDMLVHQPVIEVTENTNSAIVNPYVNTLNSYVNSIDKLHSIVVLLCFHFE
ncbi:MAG: PorT family protein [Bacteroidales bacterium]|nr:PorT family protein [Bacteroidales bacterium]